MARLQETKANLQAILRDVRYEPDTGLLWWKRQTFFCARNMTKPIGVACRGYLEMTVMSQKIYTHRVAFAIHNNRWPMPGLQIDHINRVKTDNRAANLREATASQNKRNVVLATNTSGVHGVCFDKFAGKWKAQIRKSGKQINLGRFVNLDDAARARREAEGEFHPSQVKP